LPNEYDQRQLARMRDKMDLYERRAISLGSLVDDLDGLLRALQGVHKPLRSAMRKEWTRLEEVRAVALDRRHQTLDRQAQDLVAAAVRELRQLIAQAEGPST
jgi:hypothetical protein